MDATTALHETNEIVTRLIAGLSPEHREMRTPCDQWNVHELIEHMCGGAHGIAGGLQGQAPPEETPDFLADGPAAGWAAANAALEGVATPEILGSLHEMPFGHVPGEAAMSVIVADIATHSWDLAQATHQELGMSDDLAEFSLATWKGLVPAEGPRGDNFKEAVPVADDAPAIDRLVGYTGRQP